MTKHLLKLFCGDDERHSLSKPFVQEGWQYATDGRIAIRIKADTKDTKGRKLPNMNDIFRQHSWEGCTVYWPYMHVAPWEETGIVNLQVGGRLLSEKYWILLSALGAKYDKEGEPDDPLLFTIGGIQGILMPR